MQTENQPSKPDPAAKQETGEGCSGATCSASLLACDSEDSKRQIINRLQPYQKAIVRGAISKDITLCASCFAKVKRDWADNDADPRDDKYMANYWKHIARIRHESLDAWADGEWRKALEHATELFEDIERDLVNHQDEAEKWLRAYGHLCMPNVKVSREAGEKGATNAE
jgi:hypothetical protein